MMTRVTCLMGCMQSEACAAVDYDPVTGSCQQLDLTELNTRNFANTSLDNVWWPKACTF